MFYTRYVNINKYKKIFNVFVNNKKKKKIAKRVIDFFFLTG